MPITVGTVGGNTNATGLHVGAGGATRAVTNVYVGTPGGNQLVFQAYTPMSVTAAPASVSGSVNATGGEVVTVWTNATAASVTGGVAPYTYEWMLQSGSSSGTMTPTNATTPFFYTGTSSASSVWRCTVTDSTGATAQSNDVTAVFEVT